MVEATSERKPGGKLSSEGLAVLIVDGLAEAALIRKEDFEEAVKVATLEIDIRKTAGDY